MEACCGGTCGGMLWVATAVGVSCFAWDGAELVVSGEWLEFKAPFPDDYKILLKAIQHD